ncbi:MAG: hypothetical protein M1822_000368 [Bathelium mastoideum]|nr:MAG: hypothetical protein M1822_000368 [Bathelium mastoideum]
MTPTISSHPLPVKVITVNGVEYINSPQSQTFQQPDGSSFTIGPDFINYGGKRYTFGSITSSTTLVSGVGGDVTVAPGSPPKSPSSGGLFGALDNLSKAAGNAFKSLEGIQQAATNWASGQMSDSEFGSMFPDDLNSGLAIELQDLSQSIDGISPEFVDDVGESSIRAVEAYSEAQNTIRSTLNSFKNIASNAQALAKGTNIDTVKSILQQGLGFAGYASQSPYLRGVAALSGLSAITIIDWQLHPTNKASQPAAAAPSLLMPPISNGSNSTNSTSDPTTPRRYLLCFEPGTPLSTFKNYVANLPYHGGETEEIVGPMRAAYVTNLTAAEVKERKNDAIIDQIFLDGPVKGSFTSKGNTRRADTPSSNPNLWRRDPSTIALTSLSKDPDNPESEDFNSYLYHPSLGAGTTVYVLDSGLNEDHDEFWLRGPETTGWCVPNSHTGATVPDTGPDALKDWADWNSDIQEFTGHGTAMASLAVGKNLGVASEANLVIVKVANAKKIRSRRPAAAFSNMLTDLSGWVWIFESILNDVKQKSLQRKAVVSISMVFWWNPDNQGNCALSDIFTKFVQDCAANDVVIVTALGNEGNNWYHIPGAGPSENENEQITGLGNSVGTPWHRGYEVPGRLATQFPNLITVGGVSRNGSLDIITTPVVGVGEEPITVFAVSEDIRVAAGYSNTITLTMRGSSGATATVAGLVSYFLGLPDQYTNLANSGNFLQDVKQLVQSNSWQRAKDAKQFSFPTSLLNYESSLPDRLPVIYNGAWKNFCNNNAGGAPRFKRAPQATGDVLEADLNENSTMTFDDVTATGAPIIANGTVEPDFWSIFAYK